MLLPKKGTYNLIIGNLHIALKFYKTQKIKLILC